MPEVNEIQKGLDRLVWKNWQVVVKLAENQQRIRKSLTETTASKWREGKADPLAGAMVTFEPNPNGRDWVVRGSLASRPEVALGTVVCQVAPDEANEPIVAVTAKLPKSPPGGTTVEFARNSAQDFVKSRKNTPDAGQFGAATLGGETKYDICSLRLTAPDTGNEDGRFQALVEAVWQTVADFTQIFEFWASRLIESDAAPARDQESPSANESAP